MAKEGDHPYAFTDDRLIDIRLSAIGESPGATKRIQGRSCATAESMGE